MKKIIGIVGEGPIDQMVLKAAINSCIGFVNNSDGRGCVAKRKRGTLLLREHGLSWKAWRIAVSVQAG